MAKELTMKELDELLAGELPVFVDFFATWCGPCKMFAPVLEKVSNMETFAGRIAFGKVDVDKEEGLAARYQIMGVPTLILFQNGKVLKKVTGAVNEASLIALLKEALE